jgi:hypothetical protein
MDSVKILSLVAMMSVSVISRADELNRSPLALSALQGTVCLTANHTGRSISLVDVASGKVLQELVVGNGPADIVWVDESTAIVSLLHDDAIAVVARDKDRLDLVRTILVGDEPRGLALSNDRKLWVEMMPSRKLISSLHRSWRSCLLPEFQKPCVCHPTDAYWSRVPQFQRRSMSTTWNPSN